MICPTLPYGDADFHTEYTGTISIGSDLLEMVMKRISDRLYDCGARHFVFLNGHGGNTHALSKVCRHLYKKGAVGTILTGGLLLENQSRMGRRPWCRSGNGSYVVCG